MSCTCNQSINCDPCAFCAPPGVTCLTTCAPIDPCPEKIDIDCVIYSGEDHPCSDISQGQPISQIMLQALSLIFPLEECCYFEATVDEIIPPPQQYTFCYSYNDGNCGRACECDVTSTPNTIVYSLDNPLIVGSVLYKDPALSIVASEGYYSADGECIAVSGGLNAVYVQGIAGTIQSISPCVIPTTTSTTTTLAPCYCYKVTMVSTGTILYTNCSGNSATSPSYTSGTTQSICAQAITPNARYTVAAPTQYCEDRVNCPPTTTTSTSTTTTTTTTLPPCNCITFTNYSQQANITYVDCLGRTIPDTIPAAIENDIIPSISTRCGSSATSEGGGKVDISVGSPCLGSGTTAYCQTVETTTEPCSPWILFCCGDATGTLSIKPCFPNVSAPLALNNIYKDDQNRAWIVMGTSGTATSTYNPVSLTFIGSGTLASCQQMGAGQLCPGVSTTTTAPIAKVLKFSSVDCTTACASSTTVTVYSNCGTLSLNGCRLYTNSSLTTPVTTPGFYVDTTLNTVFQCNSTGLLIWQSPCSSTQCSPTTTSTSTTTINNKTVEIINNITYSPQYPSNSGFPIISGLGQYNVQSGFIAWAGVTWQGPTAPNFTNLAPGSSLTGTYSTAPGQPLAISISRTTTGVSPTYTGNYYAHMYRNNQEVGCVVISPSAQSQSAINLGVVYSNGDAIKIVLDRTGGGAWCP